jgi:hypothetical protein
MVTGSIGKRDVMDSQNGDKMFGDPPDFAIEAGVEPRLAVPSAVWGHMRVWCAGQPLGNIGDPFCALYLSYKLFGWTADHLEDLWDDALDGLSDREAWDLLDGVLYGRAGRDGRPLERVARDYQRYDKFNFLTNWGEQFDGYKSFVLGPPGRPLRVLSRAFPESIGLGVDVSRAGFVRAARGFTEWFEAQERRLGVREG